MSKNLHSVSYKRFENLLSHYVKHGVELRVHGNSKRLPANTTSREDVHQAITFIDNIAEVHGVPLPGRLPNHRNSDITLLPSDMSKRYVFEKYAIAGEGMQFKVSSRRKFEDLWKELRPFIMTNKPATDLCPVCQYNNEKIAKSALLSEEERETLYHEALTHMQHAKTERENYRQECEQASAQWREHTASNSVSPFLGTMHYSFDFAQQIHFPHNDQQPGPAYIYICTVHGLLFHLLPPLSEYPRMSE